jgi:SAM-dependent methyltransferase
MINDKKEYILGGNKNELERLEFQHKVWKDVTDKFLKKLKVQNGWKCLDVGAGPGFVSFELRELSGDKGEVTALEPLEMYVQNIQLVVTKNSWKNFKVISENVEDAKLEEDYFDLIFVRWVIDFLPEPEKIILKLIASLKKGGIIAIQDYVYEGLALHPRGGAFDNAHKAVMKYYRSGGGDPYFPVKLSKIFRDNKIELIEFTPNILAGRSDSDVFQWGNLFFTNHLPKMIKDNFVSKSEGEALLNDWIEHKKNPDAYFFTPVVVNAAGKKL